MVNPRPKTLIFFIFSIACILPLSIFAQQIDADDIFNKLERLEKNVSDLQKGKFDSLDSSLSSGYISRNEKRIDELETNLRETLEC